jgi:hypothetical protein
MASSSNEISKHRNGVYQRQRNGNVMKWREAASMKWQASWRNNVKISESNNNNQSIMAMAANENNNGWHLWRNIGENEISVNIGVINVSIII